MSCSACEGKKLTRPCDKCGATPGVVEVKGGTEIVTFHTVIVPASRGDDETGEVRPVNGLYKNVILKYEANKHIYIYNSDGIPVRVEADIKLDFNELLNRPKYDGREMTSGTDIPFVHDSELSIRRNGTEVATFTSNSPDNVVANILVPTATSELNNDSGYITTGDLARVATTGNYSDLVNTPTLDTTISAESHNAVENAAIASALEGITGLIPNQASPENQLADKAFVNSTVQTSTANFRGSWSTWADVPTVGTNYPEDYTGNRIPTPNDYMVVGDASGYPDETLVGCWRFKYLGVWADDGISAWKPEYQVNATGFTAEQLAAINSGITASLVAKITNFTGADASTAGSQGLVPAPAAGDQDKFLKGDGTWGVVSGGGASVLACWPVGSYYETSDTTFDPNVAWGGTWVLDSAGKVTVAYEQGSSDFGTVGDTGGSISSPHTHTTAGHTLTTSEMPSHSHSFSGGYHSHAFSQGNSVEITSGYILHSTATGYGTTGLTPDSSNPHHFVYADDTSVIHESPVTDSAYTSGSVSSNGGGGSHSHGDTGSSSTSTVQPYVVVNRWHRTA